MPRRIQISHLLTSEEVASQIPSARDEIERVRLQAIHLALLKRSRTEIASTVGRSTRWVSIMIRRYNADGIDGLSDKRHGNVGASTRLSDAEQVQLDAALSSPPPAGRFWSDVKVATWIQTHLGKTLHRSTANTYMRRLGYERTPLRPADPTPEGESTKRPFEGAQRRHQETRSFADTPYPSDLTDEQWAQLRPILPVVVETTPLREIVNAMLYVLRTGCPWNYLPRDFPPKSTVTVYFYAWQRDGVWERVVHTLRPRARQKAGKNPEPTAALIDSQSVKTSKKGGLAVTMVERKSKEESAIS